MMTTGTNPYGNGKAVSKLLRFKIYLNQYE